MGILGVASSSILAYSPGAAFYGLFAIMALDLFMSVSTFLHEHGSAISAESHQAMRFINRKSDVYNDQDYQRR